MSKFEESKGAITLVLEMLRKSLVSEEMSMGITKKQLIFFKTDDIIAANYDLSKVENKFAVDVESLVK